MKPLLTDRKGTETEFELASPLSMCLTAFGTNKFIQGAAP
jgi:hypothetical protein